MVTSYLSDQMLRNLAAQPMTEPQQREVDKQLGSAVAAVSRRAGRFVQRVRAARTTGRSSGGHPVMVFRKESPTG
jgi:hypothetical protein